MVTSPADAVLAPQLETRPRHDVVLFIVGFLVILALVISAILFDPRGGSSTSKRTSSITTQPAYRPGPRFGPVHPQ